MNNSKGRNVGWIEQHMPRLYNLLQETEGRRYTAIEALKLGWSGVRYIYQLVQAAIATHSSLLLRR